MDIKVKRRLHIVDDLVNHMVKTYYFGEGYFSKTPVNYGDWSSYKENVIQAILRTVQLKFTYHNIVDSWGYEIEYEIIEYISIRHHDKIFEEYKKTAHYINNGE
jgi:hypothetical protein